MEPKKLAIAKQLLQKVYRHFKNDEDRLKLCHMIESLDIQMTTPERQDLQVKPILKLVR